MTTLTHDRTSRRAVGVGLGLAVASATSFGLSGALAGGLIAGGWSPGAAVTLRILVGTAVLLGPALVLLRGRWHQLRANARAVTVYGLVAVAACQLCYFQAIQYMQVGPALLVEYTAPVVVVAWAWWRHGHRPARTTLLGAALAGGGLVLVLDLLGGAEVSLVGVAWALGAMLGAATYFVVSADEGITLPPLVLAGGGLVVGSLVLVVAGVAGLLPMTASGADVEYAGRTVPWWLPLLALGVVTTAVSYTSGIGAGRRLGSRLASFVALSEVLAALGFAWLLLGEVPVGGQVLGGVMILAGVVVVKLGEGPTVASVTEPLPVAALRQAGAGEAGPRRLSGRPDAG